MWSDHLPGLNFFHCSRISRVEHSNWFKDLSLYPGNSAISTRLQSLNMWILVLAQKSYTQFWRVWEEELGPGLACHQTYCIQLAKEITGSAKIQEKRNNPYIFMGLVKIDSHLYPVPSPQFLGLFPNSGGFSLLHQLHKGVAEKLTALLCSIVFNSIIPLFEIFSWCCYSWDKI